MRPERRLRSFRVFCLGLAAAAIMAALGGCGGDHKSKNGTLAPPVADDYGRQMDEFMKNNPPK